MTDYISREAAFEAVFGQFCASSDETEEALNSAIEDIKRIPAADVRPVVRAHFNDDWETGCSTCSACGDGFLWEDFNGVGDWHFCPNCGADMREES